jgi:signal transduction histidine kinase
LIIADNGDGLPEQERRLFESGAATELEHTSGLGLWLVNWIVREFDGEIDVDVSNEGTTFRIWLPEPRPIGNDGTLDRNRENANVRTVRP